ncbi:MAG: protein kinase [Myxococcaceae bacterium]
MAFEAVGRYELLSKLATGGMAEVFLARQTGLQGFEKLVVVKRILPHFANNEEFVTMFVDEARTAAELSHPNVVSTFDIGQDKGAWFIAMEYLHGQDLSHLLKRAQQRGERFPIELSLRIIIDGAAGLNHAHQKKDKQGQPLNIVHRDVSPQNLFVTYDGVTKLLDFGIARAARRSSRTEAGVVKGKYGYLSPEQLDGKELDPRSDEFALGIVLWELLTQRRLFNKPSDAEVLRAVMECNIPRPSTVAPDVPAELEDVVLKALEKDPARRYKDCGEFGAALEELVERRRLNASATKLGRTLKQMFAEHAASPPGEAPPAMPKPPEQEDTRANRLSKDTRSVKRRPSAPRAKPARGADRFLAEIKSLLGPGAEIEDRPPNNVVLPHGPYIGRQEDLKQLSALFEKGAQLVTVTGLGGMGKTRISIELASRWLERKVPGGVWFVDLSDARTLDDIVKAFARTLDIDGIYESEEETVTRAGRTLAARGDTFVVLDNFEQLVPLAKDTVARWLAAAPLAKFLVTSREALRVNGEKVHQLQPLALPPQGAEAVKSEAVQLFFARLERLNIVPPTDGADLACIAEVTRRLDGVPLAIELAASRMATLRPRELLDRLSERFALLGGREEGPRGRHATLWNAIDWSYQLLSAAEQAAFAQLSVFRGGFTLEAAEGVLAVKELAGSAPVFELVEGLHRKSLLRAFVAPEQKDAVRLGMYESIQQFAQEKAEQSGEVSATRDRHAAFYLDLGEKWAEEVHGHEGADRLAWLSTERENLLEVYERAVAVLPPTGASATRALRALHALDPLLARRGPFSSHHALLDSALQLAQGVKLEKAYLAQALQALGNLHRRRGKLAESFEVLERAVKEVRAANDEPLEGRVLSDLALIEYVHGDLGSAAASMQRALELNRGAHDTAGEIQTLSSLAILHVARRELGEALAACDEALTMARAHGDAVNEARVLGTMGTLYLEDGRFELARAFFSEAVQRCREVGETRLRGYFLGKLGWALHELKQEPQALDHIEQALAALAEVGDLRHEGLFFGYRASLEALSGKLDPARVSLSAAQARLEAVKDPLLLTAQALRRLHLELLSRAASNKEAQMMLDDVRAPRGNRPARVNQNEEVRAAARLVESAMH